MRWTTDAVLREAAGWLWVPDFARTVETDDHLLVAFPAEWENPTQVLRCRADADLAALVPQVHEQALALGRTEVGWWERPGSTPPGLPAALAALGAEVADTVDVLGLDLAAGVPTVPAGVTARVVDDEASLRAAWAVDVDVWGYGPPPDDAGVAAEIAEACTPVADREAFRCLALVDGVPAATGGCTRAGEVARLWGAGTRSALRGRGAYRALVAHRIAVAQDLGATLALVKGRVGTSAPILRRLGFTVFGQERLHVVRLP